MKKTMKDTMKKACALFMTGMMLMSNVAFVHAETEAEELPPEEEKQVEESYTEKKTEEVPSEPEKPVAESYEDNDKIQDYNSKVDAYNEAAQNYNNKVDEEYENAVQETKRQNEEIAAHNAAEEARVKEAEARNEQAVKDAEQRNAEIDEENAAGQALAEKERDEKYESDLAQYEADVEQYNKDQAQYEYDAKIEKQILDRGYKSVEQYNEMINKHYNEPAQKSVQKNAEAKELGTKDTYTIQEAEEKSGKMIKVIVEHHFDEVGIEYKEEFEIDANDIITFKALCAPAENTNPGYASFYYNTDDAHKMGYWIESYSYVATNARYNNYGWECGDTHEVSLKDGTNHAYDDDGITVSYEYAWIPLSTYRTYNTPNAPVAPTAPVKGEAVFEKIPYVTPAIEEIDAADIREFMADPVKKSYLNMLSHMDLFQMPEITPAEEEPEITPAEEEPEITPVEEEPEITPTEEEPEITPTEEEPEITPDDDTETPDSEVKTDDEKEEEQEPEVTPDDEKEEESEPEVTQEDEKEEESEPEITPEDNKVEDQEPEEEPEIIPGDNEAEKSEPEVTPEDEKEEEQDPEEEPEIIPGDNEAEKSELEITPEDNKEEPEKEYTDGMILESDPDDTETTPVENEEKAAPEITPENNKESTDEDVVPESADDAADTEEEIVDNKMPEADPSQTETKEIPAAVENEQRPAAQQTLLSQITDNETPLASVEENNNGQTVIADSEAPKAVADGAWALLNLIAAIITALISVVMIVLGFKKKNDKEDDDEEKSTDRKIRVRVLSCIVAICSAIIFILTEDMTLSMQLTDNWTLLMAIILIAQAILLAVSGKKTEENNEDQAEMVEA